MVIEVTSKYTEVEDRESKPRSYADDWRVDEFFLFDPGREYLDPPLQGFRLSQGKFRRIGPKRGPLASQVLGLTLAADGPRLILRDVETGQELFTAAERAAAAEAEAARLRAELAALRRQPPTA